MGHEAVPIRLLARVIEHQRGNEMKLKIRRLKIGPAFQEGSGFKPLARGQTVSEQQILQSRAHGIERLGLAVKRDWLAAFVLHRAVQVVLQIFADTSQLRNDRNTEAAQNLRIANAGEQEQLGRVYRAAGEDYFAIRAYLNQTIFLLVFETNCAPVLEQNAGGVRMTLDGQIGSLQRRPQISGSYAPAASIANGKLIGPKAFLRIPVEIGRLGMTSVESRLDECAEQRILRPAVRNMQGALAAVKIVCAVFVALRTLEIGKHICKRPAFTSHLAPTVVIAGMSADVNHAIDRR